MSRCVPSAATVLLLIATNGLLWTGLDKQAEELWLGVCERWRPTDAASAFHSCVFAWSVWDSGKEVPAARTVHRCACHTAGALIGLLTRWSVVPGCQCCLFAARGGRQINPSRDRTACTVSGISSCDKDSKACLCP